MKTNVILKAVVMVAVVMASVLNFSANAMNPTDYVKNEEMSGELVTAVMRMVIYSVTCVILMAMTMRIV